MRLISFDISSSVIGWAIFDIDQKSNFKFFDSGWFKPFKKGDIFENLTKLKEKINELLKKYNPTEAAIEDIAQFMPNVSSANTIIKLALYNRVVGLTVFDYLGKSPHLYSVMAIRHGIKLTKSLPKKEEIPNLVENHLGITLPVNYKKTGTVRSELYDEADAIGCGLFHCLKYTGKLKGKNK